MGSEFNFLIASERSGSNLISKMFNAHPEVCSPSPAHLFRLFLPKINRYTDSFKLVSDVFEMWQAKLAPWQLTVEFDDLGSYAKEDPIRSFFSVVRYLYKSECKVAGKKISFIKENQTYNFYSELVSEFPDSRFVMLVRDPRDMALSWMESPVHRGDIVRAATVWKNDQSASLKLMDKYKNRILLVKYEELVVNPKVVLTRLCNHLNIEFEEEMLSFQNRKEVVQQANVTDNWKNLSKQLMTSNFNKYRSSLTKDQVLYIENVCHTEMDLLGYARDYELLPEQSFLELQKKLVALERNDKPQYNSISESEKEIRKRWMELSRKIGA